MKRFFIIIICAIFLLSMASCAKEIDYSYDPTPSAQDTTDPQKPITSLQPVSQKPMVALTMPTITETEKSDDGTVLMEYTYQNISLIVPDPEVGNRVILDFLNRIDETADTAQSVLESAKDAYTGADNWLPYVCSASYAPVRLDYGVLSLFGQTVVYNASAHPETVNQSFNYDLVTGEVLSLDRIMSANADLDALCDLVTTVLSEQEEDKMLYDGYTQVVKDRFSLNSADWYFSKTGLTFYFPPYEIAPYASGVIYADIPYEKLTGILSDAYFPAERESAGGKLTAELFTSENAQNYTQFAEVILDASGQDRILLHTDHYVQDVRIEYGSWSADGSNFIPQSTVFAAYGITPGDAIMLQTNLELTAPQLLISYRTGEETVYSFISGTEDNAVILK